MNVLSFDEQVLIAVAIMFYFGGQYVAHTIYNATSFVLILLWLY